jgi:hypothetical protein
VRTRFVTDEMSVVLARAVGPEQAEEVAVLDGQVEAVERQKPSS